MTKVSIIMASYNYAQYIKKAIDSILAQTFDNWELIVVDDGSIDNSVEIIKSYCEKDLRIKLYQHENAQNKGLKETLLLGLSKAQGEWVAFLESDDEFEPQNLEEKIKIIEKRKTVQLLFSKVNFVCENDNLKEKESKLRKILDIISKKNYPCNLFYDLAFYNYILTFSNVLIKKDAILKLNFDVPDDYLLDWWLWIQLSYKNDFYFIDKPLLNWRLHEQSYIQNSKKNPINQLNIRMFYLKTFITKINFKALFIFVISLLNTFVKKLISP
jgi:teichuronic acid biosynthesis glycosyltransferase TuaG